MQFNQVIINGFITHDTEEITNGLKLSLANNKNSKHVNYLTVMIFEKTLVNNFKDRLKKGDHIQVVGSLEVSKQDKWKYHSIMVETSNHNIIKLQPLTQSNI